MQMYFGCFGFCFATTVLLQIYIFQWFFFSVLHCIETTTDIQVLLPLLLSNLLMFSCISLKAFSDVGNIVIFRAGGFVFVQ